MRGKKITDITPILAEDMTSVLDYLSRVIGAADNGSPNYMHDKAGQLALAAERLHRHMSDLSATPEPPYRHDPSRTFAPARLRALIARDARHYVAGRALYPHGGDPIVAARRAALESAATDMRYGTPAGLTPAQADAVAAWLLARAEREATS